MNGKRVPDLKMQDLTSPIRMHATARAVITLARRKIPPHSTGSRFTLCSGRDIDDQAELVVAKTCGMLHRCHQPVGELLLRGIGWEPQLVRACPSSWP